MTYIDVVAREIRSAVRQDAVPAEDTADLFRLYAVLLLAKGDAVTREDVHNAWVAWMLARNERHESLVPFSDLDPQTQVEDAPFVDAIREVARARQKRAVQDP
jgi:hypothetical protein